MNTPDLWSEVADCGWWEGGAVGGTCPKHICSVLRQPAGSRGQQTNIYMKFREESVNGFQVIERTRFCDREYKCKVMVLDCMSSNVDWYLYEISWRFLSYKADTTGKSMKSHLFYAIAVKNFESSEILLYETQFLVLFFFHLLFVCLYIYLWLQYRSAVMFWNGTEIAKNSVWNVLEWLFRTTLLSETCFTIHHNLFIILLLGSKVKTMTT